MPQGDIKMFIDFFHEASQKIRGVKPVFFRGKDGNLVKLALRSLSRTQLEMLAVWFLAKKPKLTASLGAMLSRVVLEELMWKIKEPYFWKDLDDIYGKFYTKTPEKLKTFEPKSIAQLINNYGK